MSFHDMFYTLKQQYLEQGMDEVQATDAAIAEIQYKVATEHLVLK